MHNLVHQTLSLVTDEWDLTKVQQIEYLPGGYSNHNYAFEYEGRRYVLRIPQVNQPFVDRHHEAGWYERLPKWLGPKPLYFNPNNGVMLSRWIDGDLLINVGNEIPMEQLAAYLRNLHANLPDSKRVYPLESLTRIYFDEKLPTSFPINTPQVALTCHNDLNPWNIIITEQGWQTLDWEFVGHNDPLFDLVSLHLGLCRSDDELLSFAECYLQQPIAGLHERVHKLLQQYWLREQGWAQFQVKLGNQRKEIAAQVIQAKSKLAILQQN